MSATTKRERTWDQHPGPRYEIAVPSGAGLGGTLRIVVWPRADRAQLTTESYYGAIEYAWSGRIEKLKEIARAAKLDV